MSTEKKEPHRWWIEFDGDPTMDCFHRQRYVSGKQFEPEFFNTEVIEVIEASAYDSLAQELATVKEERDQARAKIEIAIRVLESDIEILGNECRCFPNSGKCSTCLLRITREMQLDKIQTPEVKP